jgi:hypothetical protein
MTVVVDVALVELIDALVEAVDADRADEIDRLRSALEPFGGCQLFDAELRLSARESCGCWEAA